MTGKSRCVEHSREKTLVLLPALIAYDVLLGANEGEQIGVDLVRVHGGHSVRQPGIGL
jgi:hypothetical protein